MSKLIALVATAVILNGERTVIQPGEYLPDLSEHDEGALVRSGAAEDPEVTAARAKAHVLSQATGQAEFAAARKRVQQEQVSTKAAPEGETGETVAGVEPDAGSSGHKPAAKPKTPSRRA